MIAAASALVKSRIGFIRLCSTNAEKMLVEIVANGVGSLQEMESKLDCLGPTITPSLVTHVINSASNTSNGCSRRLLRFVSWCRKASSEELGDEVFNEAIRAFSKMKDATAMEIALSSLEKEGRKIEFETFAHAVEVFVKLGRPEKAVSLFRNIEEKRKLEWRHDKGGEFSSVTAAVHALCVKGHARKAQGILWHHKDKVKTEAEQHHHRSLVLHGWSVHGNAREARRVVEEMKGSGNRVSIASYHDLLRCICKRNLRFNPSALVSEATNIMTEMRSSGISPTSVSFNILLSCLGKARRVKEAFGIFMSMFRGDEGKEAAPDHISYYIVIRLLYLTRTFDRGNKLANKMIEEEEKGRLTPRVNSRFYHGLIGVLCGMEEMEQALKMFERMKKRCCSDREEEDGPATNHNCGHTYDMLIAKLCRNGKFDVGRRLWDEAKERGITLECSSDLLDPLKMQVFKPTRKSSIDKISTVKSGKRRILVQKKNKEAITISNKKN